MDAGSLISLAPPSFQAYALFEPSSSTFTQSKGLFVDLTNSLLAGVILEANLDEMLV
jgi:hypothetical protein